MPTPTPIPASAPPDSRLVEPDGLGVVVLVEPLVVTEELVDAGVGTNSYAVRELTQVALVNNLLGRTRKRPMPVSQQLSFLCSQQ